eukprot:c1043_g1_i1.p1 GENE.c1043_g1_i1~~c1043_g1_i1.p1  ORF type:complete len:141 (-),score=23.73 c1043_g1_i1:256-678(-)
MRFREIPPEGAVADLMWSDPDPSIEGFAVSARGAGCVFGNAVVRMFCQANNITHITRAHQLCMEGYQILFGGALSTVWSAPNYVNKCGNCATVLEVSENLDLNFNVFWAAPSIDRETSSSPSLENSSNILENTNFDCYFT